MVGFDTAAEDDGIDARLGERLVVTIGGDW